MAFQGEWAEELEVDRARGSFMTGLKNQSHTTFGVSGGLLGKVQQYFSFPFWPFFLEASPGFVIIWANCAKGILARAHFG